MKIKALSISFFLFLTGNLFGQSCHTVSDTLEGLFSTNDIYVMDADYDFNRTIKPNKNINRFSVEDRLLVLGGKVREGFTKKQTRASWGKPDRVQKFSVDEKSKIKTECWFYGSQIVFFIDGKLSSVI